METRTSVNEQAVGTKVRQLVVPGKRQSVTDNNDPKKPPSVTTALNNPDKTRQTLKSYVNVLEQNHLKEFVVVLVKPARRQSVAVGKKGVDERAWACGDGKKKLTRATSFAVGDKQQKTTCCDVNQLRRKASQQAVTVIVETKNEDDCAFAIDASEGIGIHFINIIQVIVKGR